MAVVKKVDKTAPKMDLDRRLNTADLLLESPLTVATEARVMARPIGWTLLHVK